MIYLNISQYRSLQPRPRCKLWGVASFAASEMLLKGSKGFLHSSSHLRVNYSISNQMSKGIAAADDKIPHSQKYNPSYWSEEWAHHHLQRQPWVEAKPASCEETMQLTPDRKGFTCKVISALSHLQLFRKSLGGTGRTVANICVFGLRHACTGKCVLGCSNLQKMQTFHISLTASRHIEPSISTSHLIRHHLKVLSYSVCGKVLPKKMAQEK